MINCFNDYAVFVFKIKTQTFPVYFPMICVGLELYISIYLNGLDKAFYKLADMRWWSDGVNNQTS